VTALTYPIELLSIFTVQTMFPKSSLFAPFLKAVQSITTTIQKK
jgi:hypothetical protein